MVGREERVADGDVGILSAPLRPVGREAVVPRRRRARRHGCRGRGTEVRNLVVGMVLAASRLAIAEEEQPSTMAPAGRT